ncbi:MAG: hypothetical protein K2L67_01065 [Clostridia bacterium]|nr:hypothetical protein [Clostridia bacterium]
MYDKLICDFKNELIDRKLDIIVIISFSALFLIYIIVFLILFSIFNHWLVILLSNLILAGLSIIIAYTIIYFLVKAKCNFVFKDYFHFINIIKALSNLNKKDIQILLPILKSHKINTYPKIQEAIKYYRGLLQRKSTKNFTIISILSLVMSITSIILSSIKFQTNRDLILLLMLLFSLMLCAILVCIVIKIFYRAIYYNISDYALYERIEDTLSEIYMKELI